MKTCKPKMINTAKIISYIFIIIPIIIDAYNTYRSYEIQKYDRINYILNDFSQIATMTKSRVENLKLGKQRLLDVNEYKRTLQLNYRANYKFVEEELNYKNFKHFYELTQKLTKENEIQILNEINKEFDNLFEQLVKQIE